MSNLKALVSEYVTKTTETITKVNNFLMMDQKQRKIHLNKPEQKAQLSSRYDLKPQTNLQIEASLDNLSHLANNLTPSIKHFLGRSFSPQLAFICNDIESDLTDCIAMYGKRLGMMNKKMIVLTDLISNMRHKDVKRDVVDVCSQTLKCQLTATCFKVADIRPVVIDHEIEGRCDELISDIGFEFTRTYSELKREKSKVWLSDNEESEELLESMREFPDQGWLDRMAKARQDIEGSIESVEKVVCLVERLGTHILQMSNSSENNVKLEGRMAVVNFHFTKLSDQLGSLSKSLDHLREDAAQHNNQKKA
jgi:hypothetical protein